MSQPYTLLWFRKNLRIDDNIPLITMSRQPLPAAAIYIFDDAEFGPQATTRFGNFAKTGKHRLRFIVESLRDLERQLRERYNMPLIVRLGDSADVFAKLGLKPSHIYYQRELGSEEQLVERRVKDALPLTEVHAAYGHNLIDTFDVRQLPDVFTAFRHKVEKRMNIRTPEAPPANIHVWEEAEKLAAQNVWPDIDTEVQSNYPGGETAAVQRLSHYLWKSDAIKTYKQTRNGMLRYDDSTKFSPYLAQGCISPQRIYDEIRRYEAARGANESTYWVIFELLWRDYFWFVHQKQGNRIFAKNGFRPYHLAEPSWLENEIELTKWLEGRTGYPIVDASMRELAATGFMSNRGRQNVCSYLAKTLGIDWRFGAAWFESQLIDYDVALNYGNWCYGAGVGNDPREGRIFNVTKQWQTYDPDGSYARTWLNE